MSDVVQRADPGVWVVGWVTVPRGRYGCLLRLKGGNVTRGAGVQT